jgi:hypothetical protein
LEKIIKRISRSRIGRSWRPLVIINTYNKRLQNLIVCVRKNILY